MPKAPLYVRATTLDYLAPPSSKSAFAKTLAKDTGLRALRDKAITDGFTPHTGSKANWGMKSSWTTSAGETLTYEWHIMALRRGKDEAAVCTESLVSSRREKEVYHSLLTAPNGNFTKASEHYATKSASIRLAHSKWTRFKACVKKSSCGSVCVAALTTCSGSWAAYLGCVAIACGGCMGKCAACALCNCRWWCKWAVGCCKD